jgi:hypothetical protein
MDGYDLWTEASREPEAEQRALRSATAAAHLEGLTPFLLAARSAEEHEHRLAMAAEPIELIAERTGLTPGDVEDQARRHFALRQEALRFTAEEGGDEDEGQVIIVDKRTGAKLAGPMSAEEAHEKLEDADFGVPREELGIEKVQEGDDRAEDEDEEGGESKEASRRRTALPEGVNPLGWLEGMDGGAGGPEKPDEHVTQYSGDGSYSEIPMGQQRGPDPAVTGWIDPQRDNNGANDEGQVSPDDHLARKRSFRRMAAAPAQAPERTGRQPQQNAGGARPVPGGGRPAQQPGDPMGRQVPLTTRPHQGPGGGPAAPPAPEPTSVVGIPVPMPAGAGAGAPQDPAAGAQSQPGATDQTITAAARLIRQHNPGLPDRECRRIGARMAARYYQGVSSVYDDDPGPSDSDGGGSHFIPKPGGGDAGDVADVAEDLPELAL